MQYFILVKIFLFFTFLTQPVQAVPACPGSHCSKVSAIFYKFCTDNGLGSNVKFPVIAPDGNSNCECNCSCFSLDTELTLGSGVWSTLPELTANGSEFLLNPLTAKSVSLDKALGSKVDKVSVVKVKFSNGSELVVSENHTFVTPEKVTIMAEELVLGATVLDDDLGDVRVISIDKAYAYTGSLANVITASSSMKAEDHVISTNGILSGDWLLQITSDTVKGGVDLRTQEIVKMDRTPVDSK